MLLRNSYHRRVTNTPNCYTYTNQIRLCHSGEFNRIFLMIRSPKSGHCFSLLKCPSDVVQHMLLGCVHMQKHCTCRAHMCEFACLVRARRAPGVGLVPARAEILCMLRPRAGACMPCVWTSVIVLIGCLKSSM